MGYTSTIEGMITFDPPINWAQYQDAGRFRAVEHGAEGHNWLRLELTTETVDTDDGVLNRRSANMIVSRYDEYGPLKGAEIGVGEDLRDLLITLIALDPNRTYSGELLREGERQGDVQRYWIENATTAGTNTTAACIMTARAYLDWNDPEVLTS